MIGTKLDLVGESRSRTLKRSSFICDEYGADEVFIVSFTHDFCFRYEPKYELLMLYNVLNFFRIVKKPDH